MIEAFLLLLLLAFLPAKQASAQTYPVVDAFSGSGALSSNWTNTTATGLGYVPLARNSGAVGPSVSGQQGLAIYTGTTFANDQYAQATFVNHLAGGGATGVCVRMNLAGDGVCYLADWGRIYAMVDGAISYTIAEACPVPSSGDTIQIIAVGGLYTCNDVTAGTSSSGSDPNYSLGSPGILIDQTISTAYALSHFQADCFPSCGLFSGSGAATYPLSDSFSGSGALSSNWTSTLNNGYVALTQNSGTAGLSVAGQAGLAIYTGVTFSDDQYAQAVFVNQNSSNSATGVCVRMDSSGTGVCYLAGDGLLYALDQGGGVDGIASCPIPSAGDTIRLSVIGAVYTCQDVSTGSSGTGIYWANSAGHPAILVDQRQSADVLAHFQADCIPSCATYVHPPTIIALGSFSTTATNPGFNNTATTYVPGSSEVNNGSTATYNLSPGAAWHSPLNSSSYVSYDPGNGPLGSVVAPNGDYYYTTTFTIGSNVLLSSTSGTLSVLADDTVAVYLNGSLIQPSAGPIGDDNPYSHCSYFVPTCGTPITFNLTGLVTGQNVLTFDVKQVALVSEGLDYWGTIAVNALTGVTIGVTPTNATLYAGQTQQLTVTVGNNNNNAVTWTLTPSGLGSISSAGLFTAPATIASQQTVIVTATSQADPTASASAVLTMAVARPDLAVTANGGSSYEPGQTVTLAINAHNVGGADASSTNINIIAPDGTSSALPAFPLTVGQNAGKQAVYTVPAIPQPPAPQALPASTDSALFNVNLIVNGNAEATVGALNDQIAPSVPGWTRTGNFTTAVYGNCCGFPEPQDPGPSNRGSNFFYGGPDSASSSATQNIDVSSAAELVDSGFVKYNFSAWLGGFSTQSDNAVITAAFQDSTGNTISTATLGPVTEQDRGGLTGLLLRSTNGFLPPKTRTVTITIVMTRLQGSDNDGYADNFSFVLSGPSNSGTVDAGTANYLAALGAADNISLPFTIQTTWTDALGGSYGPKKLQTQTTEVLPIVGVSLNASSAGVTGSNVRYTATITNTGHAVASGLTATISLPDGTSQNLSLSSTTLAPQANIQATTNFVIPLAQQSGPLFARVAVSWTDTANNSYGPVLSTASSDVAQLAVLLQNDTFICAPAARGPYISGTPQTFIATLTDPNGAPVSGVNVSFSATGANTSSGGTITDANGRASFQYTGTHIGIDNVQASINLGAALLTSNGVPVSWVSPVQALSTTSITGMFYAANGSGIFNATASTPAAFSQSFPTIGFEPPTGVVPNNTSSSIGFNAPFIDVTTDIAGNFSGVLPTRAGSGTLTAFQASFSGSLLVSAPGNVGFTVYSDSGCVFGIGNGATAAGGVNVNPPSSGLTAISGLPVMGAYNQAGGPSAGSTITVYFPQAGNYPYELDYATTGTVSPVLTLASSANSGLIVPPAGALQLTPIAVTPQTIGNVQAVNVRLTDAMGNLVANQAVTLTVTGANPNLFNIHYNTDVNGNVSYSYTGTHAGVDVAQATTLLYGNTVPSNALTVQWGSQTAGSPAVTITADPSVTLPNKLLLTGTVTGFGSTFTTTWTKVSGPGTVTFDVPSQTTTQAAFSVPGAYVLQLGVTAGALTGTAQVTITVNPVSGTAQGWIGSPADGATISGVVPITVSAGTTLQSGTLTFYPANNPNNVTVLNANTTGSGAIGVMDTTALANGAYWITLQATNAGGDPMYSLALVTVAGNYKPGRVTSTVTDLIVPATGLAINIQRRYDSLNAGKSSDFGYGWSLGTTVDLTVSPKGDVTFTLGGIRRTFHLTPQFGGWLLPYYYVAFTPEPGFYGTLTDSSPGCSDFFDFVFLDGSLWTCVSGGFYNPPGYVYTDPSGTSYTISASGNLQSVNDKNGNALTISSTGITTSTGLSVPFTRDSSGRITTITDPQGHQYQYAYDGSGNLHSVTYPNTTQPSTYTYDSNHLYLSGTDFRSNPLPTTDYYISSDTDSNGLPLNGRLKSVTDALGKTTSYAYNLLTKTTTVTYPPDANGGSGTAQMVYDSYGMLLSSTDPLGHATTNVYDSNHNLTSTTNPLGHTSTYTYDSSGNRTSVTYPQTGPGINTTSSTAYNQFSEPTSTTDELGNVRTFTYDANFNPQNVTDAAGTLTTFAFNSNGTLQAGAIGYDINTTQSSAASHFTYDTNGNMTSRTDALGRVTSYTYDSLGHKVTMVQPLPNSNTSQAAATTTYTYDALGNLTQTAAPLGRTANSTYDGNGNKISDTDPLGHITTYQYDALNRLTTTTYPTQPSTTTTRTYDFRNNVVDETDQAGHIAHHVYDLAGRLTSLTKAYGTSNASTTTYTYYNDSRKQSETDALAHTTTYTYDAAGRLTAVAGVKGNVSYGYDAAGNRTSSTDGDGNTTQYQYDARKRLTKTIYPDTTSVTNGYDGPGNLTSVTDQAGNIVQYTFDAANQLQSVIQVNSPNSSNNTTTYGYDKDGNLTNLTDANGHSTTNAYDLLYNLTTNTLPDSSSRETRTYDTEGNLLSLQHFNGKTTTYAYDPLNRLLTRTPDSSYSEPVVSFTYTSTGKRASMTDASGTTNYTYDSLDRLTAKTTPEGTLNYTYDAASNVASMSSSNANGVSVGYTYDSLNRLSTVVDNRLGSGQNTTTTYTYDTASNVVTATYPNNLQSTFHYDQLNRLTALTTPDSGYLYQLGPTGNRTNATELTGRTLNWSYDGIYRLTSESVSLDPAGKNGAVGYGLDPVGNRLSANSTLSGVSSSSYSYNINDLFSIETYDANGNTLITGGKTFTYDSENRLKSMNGSAVLLQYDGDDNRAAKIVGGVTTRYLVDDLNPTGYSQVVEELVSGAVQREYTYGLQRISQNQVINNTWTPSFYGYDGMGNVRQLTNAGGVITDKYDYDAFGNPVNSTGTTPNDYRYRGEQYDPDLNLYYLRARYMNPLTGTFMSRDPEDGFISDPKTLHKYVYADGDPVNATDPSGRSAVMEDLQITIKIDIGALPAVYAAGCAVSVAYNVLARKVVNDANITPTLDCKAKGKGRMRIQLQFSVKGSGLTVPEATQDLENDDPPGVTLGDVESKLDNLANLTTNTNLPGFPRKLRKGVPDAIDEIKECAARFVPYGTLGWPKTICSADIGGGWRIDLDQLNGWNLRQ